MKLLFLSFFFLCLSLHSQNEITGIVKDSNGFVEFANVILIDQSNTFVTGTTTDESGQFKLQVKDGLYTLKVSFIGYDDVILPLDVSEDIELETLTLRERLNELGEIIITGKKDLISRKGEKLIMNISNNTFVKGKTVSDILKYAPNVWVDQTSNAISIKGLAATILIDGRRTNMSHDNLMTYLNGLSNDELKSIEIISNPSARYDAEGLSGIINIVTNKKKNKAINGGFNSRTIFNKFISYSNSLQINSSLSDKLSISVFGLYQENDNLSEEDRIETIINPPTIYNYKKVDSTQSSDAFANVDLSYDLTENDQLVFQLRALKSDSKRQQNNDLLITENQTISSNGFYDNKRDSKYYALGLNYNHTLDTLGQNLNFIVDYYNSETDSNDNYVNLFFDESMLINSNQRRANAVSTYKIFSTQLDYQKPVDNNQLEFGSKYSYVKNRSNSVFENLIDDAFIIDLNFTNAFEYKEQIAAVYGSYSLDNIFDKRISLQFGVRGEFTSGNGIVQGADVQITKDYFNIFPSVFLTKALEKKRSIGLSYSRRINRPNYSRFNPTIFYLTDFTSQVGNPDLDPAYTNAFEINYNSSSLNLQLYFNDINGESREILTQLNDTELRYQWRNIDKTTIYGISLSYNQKINTWCTMFFSTSYYQKKYLSTFADAVDNIDTSKGTIQGRIASQISLPFNIKSEISFEYNGDETYGQFESLENYAFYLDVSKKITNDLNVYLKVIDPFDKLRYQFRNTQQNIQTTQFRNNFNQAIQVSLQYNFDFGGKTKGIRYNRSSQELKNRSN